MAMQERRLLAAAGLFGVIAMLCSGTVYAGKDIKTDLMPPNKVALVVYSPETHVLAAGHNRAVTLPGTLNDVYDRLNKELPNAGVQLITEETILNAPALKKGAGSKAEASGETEKNQAMTKRMEADLAKMPPQMQAMMRQRMQASLGQMEAMKQDAAKEKSAEEFAPEDKEDRAFPPGGYISTTMIEANRGLARKSLSREEQDAILDSLGRTATVKVQIEPKTNQLVLHISVFNNKGKLTGFKKVSAKFPGSIRNKDAGGTWIEQIHKTVPLVMEQLLSEIKE